MLSVIVISIGGRGGGGGLQVGSLVSSTQSTLYWLRVIIVTRVPWSFSLQLQGGAGSQGGELGMRGGEGNRRWGGAGNQVS